MKRYALRDEQWERIKDLLPGRQESVGCTAKDNRLFVEAVLYRYRVVSPLKKAGKGIVIPSKTNAKKPRP